VSYGKANGNQRKKTPSSEGDKEGGNVLLNPNRANTLILELTPHEHEGTLRRLESLLGFGICSIIAGLILLIVRYFS
jgi:hypothetical protein